MCKLHLFPWLQPRGENIKQSRDLVPKRRRNSYASVCVWYFGAVHWILGKSMQDLLFPVPQNTSICSYILACAIILSDYTLDRETTVGPAHLHMLPWTNDISVWCCWNQDRKGEIAPKNNDKDVEAGHSGTPPGTGVDMSVFFQEVGHPLHRFSVCWCDLACCSLC